MSTIEQVKNWRGLQVVDRDGDKIGKVDEIYLDEQTGQPEWLAVKTGFFGSNVTFIPLAQASAEGDSVRVPFEKSHVKDAPNADPDGHLSQQEEAALYRYYGMEYSESRSDSGLPEGGAGGRFNDEGRTAGTVGHDVSGPTTDDAMTRSEEELKVGTVKEEAGRVRLRKYVVTEDVTQTVPVEREEIRVEREPITDANIGDATSGPEISEEEHEVVLHEERPVVQKEVVPKERVRLDTETHTDQETVSEQVRSERIDVDEDGSRKDR